MNLLLDFSIGISIGVCGLDCREKIVQEVVESCNKNIVCLGDIGIGIIVLQLIAITGA